MGLGGDGEDQVVAALIEPGDLGKFGEPPPLAIDVYSTVSDDHARLQALTLLATLEEYTGWSIRPDFTR